MAKETIYVDRTIHFDDIGYTVLTRAEIKPPDQYGAQPIRSMDFEVYQIRAREIGGIQGRAYGDARNRSDYHDMNWTADPPTWGGKTTERYAHGDVRWDGCSNWHFDAQDDCMIHFCGKSSAVALGTLMGRVYEACAETMKPYDLEMFNGSPTA